MVIVYFGTAGGSLKRSKCFAFVSEKIGAWVILYGLVLSTFYQFMLIV